SDAVWLHLWRQDGGPVLLLSEDAGASFSARDQGLPWSLDHLAFDAASPTTLLATDDTRVYRSLDRGLGWAPFEAGLPAGQLYSTSLLRTHPGVPGRALLLTTHGAFLSDGG